MWHLKGLAANKKNNKKTSKLVSTFGLELYDRDRVVRVELYKD